VSLNELIYFPKSIKALVADVAGRCYAQFGKVNRRRWRVVTGACCSWRSS